jgi:hypothetical protein
MNKVTDKEKRMLLVILLIIVICFSVAILFNTYGGARGVVVKYASGMKNSDSEKIVSVFHESMILESYENEKEMIEYFDSTFKEMEEEFYIIKKYKINDDYKQYEKDEISKIAKELNDYYKINEDDLTEVRRYKVSFEMLNDGEEETSETKIVVGKIKGKWYYIAAE